MTLCEARTTKSPRYFTGKPCPRGHICERMTCNKVCVQCLYDDTKRRDSPSSITYYNKKNRNKKWRRSNSPRSLSYKISIRLRARLNLALRNGQRAGSAVRDLGCTIPQLRDYLSERFAPGMSWDNYGAWHIDHVRPLASFDLDDRPQLLIAVHYTNLQPLWAADNIAKGAAI